MSKLQYKVEIFFPDGNLLKKCTSELLSTHYSAIGICSKKEVKEWHYGMLWVAERQIERPQPLDWGMALHKPRPKKRAILYANGGKILKEYENVYAEGSGDFWFLYDCDTGVERCATSAPISLVENK